MTNTLNLNFAVKRVQCFILLLFFAVFPVFLGSTGVILANDSFRQEKQQITGKVTDGSTGEVLPGVSILIKGTTQGTVTDLDGNYSVLVAPTDILVFSYVGFLTQEVPVENKTVADVSLSQDIIGLDEVIVTGYGMQKKSDLTGAVASVSGKELSSVAVIGADQALQGRAAGVSISPNTGLPGGSVSIAIRGISSINGTQPLVIVDGVRASLTDLNPNDIESVEILKDASSAAIYGATGGNGVILVTTKKGKSGDPVTSFNYFTGWQKAWKKMDMMNTQEYAELHNIMAAMRGNEPWSSQPDTLKDYDYQELMMRVGLMQDYDLSIRGGSDKSNFFISANYTKQEGVLQKTDYDRLSIRINADQKLSKRIKTGENVTFTRSKRNGFQEWMFQNAYNSPMTNVLKMVPYLPPYSTRGADSTVYPGLSGEFPLSASGVTPILLDPNNDTIYDKKWSSHPNAINPQRDVDIMNYEARNYSVGGKFFVDLNLFKGFTYTSVVNAYSNFNFTEDYDPAYYYNTNNYNKDDDLTRENAQQYGWELQNYMNYNITIAGSHNIGGMVGIESHYDKWIQIRTYREQLINTSPEMRYFSASTNDTSLLQIPTDQAWERSDYSYFGRLTYDFKSMLLANFSIRKDYSSRFGPDYRSGIFPSGSVGFKFTELNFLKNNEILSFGKLRVGLGQTGANAPSNYAYYARINSTLRALNYPFSQGNTSSQGACLVQLPNYEMHWETMIMGNIGIDLSFLKNSLNLTVDYFLKESKDMLQYESLPATSGMYQWATHATDLGGDARPLVNIGTIRNSGIEFTIGYRKMEGNLKVSLDFNGMYQKNKVISMAGNDTIYRGAVGPSLTNICMTAEGQPMAQFYGYKTDGLFRSVDEVNAYSVDGVLIQPNAVPGDFKFVDINGDGQINQDDKTIIGNPIPKFIMGFTANLEYKNFDLNLFFEGKFGHDVFNGAKLTLMSQQPGINRLSTVLDQYREPIYDTEGNLLYAGNTDTDEPRLGLSDPNNNFRVSDYYVESGSYLRLKNLQLGYTLPSVITKKVGVDRFRVYVGAKNLLTFTKYKGWDPEFNSSPTLDYTTGRKDMMQQGIDVVANYPQPMMFMVGVNLQF